MGNFPLSQVLALDTTRATVYTILIERTYRRHTPMNIFKTIRNLMTRKAAGLSNIELVLPDLDTLTAKLDTFAALIDRAADAEGWNNLRTEELLDLADLATPEAWYTQLQQAAPMIESERAHLAAALSHMDESAWPLTSAEYATATAAMALTMLVWSGEIA